MATGQDLLNLMEDLNGELQLQTGEPDQARGLRALNAAQDMFESVVAQYPEVIGGTTTTVTTTANTEYSTYPTGLLRLDRLWYLDPTTSRPVWPISKIKDVGGHAQAFYWLTSLITTQTAGRPRWYWTNGTNIYWDPLPDATYTVRLYGFKAASDITASGTFAYQDNVKYPLATLAGRLMKTGLDDPIEDMVKLSQDLFGPLIEQMTNYNRDGAKGFIYSYNHDS